MATVPVDALIDFEIVSNAILRSDRDDALSRKVFEDGGKFEGEGVRSVNYASNRVKNYLKRRIHVHQLNPVLTNEDWEWTKRTPDKNYPFKLSLSRVEDWPIITVDEDVVFHPNRERTLYAKKQHNTLLFWAGYRRDGQNLNDLGLTGSIISDKKDIPLINGTVVEDVATKIAIYWATIQIRGLIATSSVSQNMGDFQTSVQKENFSNKFENQQLNRISSERYIVG